MKILIAYGTKYGSVKKCAEILKENLEGSIDLYDLKKDKEIDLAKYDKVIIGGSIYMGKIQKEVKAFCEKNMSVLKDKRLGLYICCMREKEEAKEQLKNSFSESLLSHASAANYLGYSFDLKKMNFLHRFTIKKVAGVTGSQSNFDKSKIEEFAKKMAQ